MAIKSKPGMWASLRTWCQGLIAGQAALYSAADRKRLKLAGLAIVAAILVGGVGAFLQRQASLFFNALVVALIISQGLIGACRIRAQEKMSYILMVASLLVLLMSFAF